MTHEPPTATATTTNAAAIAPSPADEFLWLEDVGGEQPLAWARTRNVESAATLETAECVALEHRILDILDSDARIPYVEKQGAWWYNFWQDAARPRGVFRRTTFDEYRKAQPAWETVLDLDALAAAENENWVWHGGDFQKPGYTRCLLSLSRGGADASVVREFDVETRSFVPEGFTLPEAKSSVGWRDDDSLYVGTDFGPGSLTTSGYPRIAKLWRRGTPLAAAETIFEGAVDDVWVIAFRDGTKGFERHFVRRGISFYTNEMLVLREDAWVRIDKPDSAIASAHRDLLLIELRDDWTPATTTHAAGSLLACGFDAFLAGDRRFDVLFEPTDRKSLAGMTATRNAIIVNELDNVRNRIYVLARNGGAWTRTPLPGMPAFGTISASAVDADESDEYFVTVTDYVTPTSLYFGGMDRGAPELMKQLPAYFDATGLVVTQHETASKDGTRIPYFQIARADLALDGSHPTLLRGYGGFEISELPVYSGGIGAAWLEWGGIYVVANIRGGGEFGPRWHQAALKSARHKAYEDFIAVAEDLVRRNVTTPAHLGIKGGSNGGLLMGNMLTRRPDLFGAIVCQVPLLDMRRYHRLLAGASWIGEYGDPDDPDEWAFIRTFSPYHNLRDGVRYPPTLFMTSTRDDRVHPGHARKMAARMAAAGHDVLYYENIEGGHGGAANNRQQAHMNALAYTFLRQRLR
ncbi:MAG: prolyl oligopeptidase family serine peptidase [Betaproteobacteria bacterium]